MKRTQLYQMVWGKPMTKLGTELGISDVGLAKACRRHGIPVPPRGHWAKLAAGKPSPQIPLPNPGKEEDVRLTLTDPDKRSRERANAQAKRVAIEERIQTLPPIDDAAEARPHPMVKATLAYIARIPALEKRHDRLSPMDRLQRDIERPPYVDKGRRRIHVSNGLHLTVSDASAEWALAMHDKLMKSLSAMGCKFSLGQRHERDPIALICERKGEQMFFTFSEGCRRHELTEEELSAARKRNQWTNTWEWRPSGKFTWSIRGSEYSLDHQWAGKRPDIEAKLSGIVATCLDFLDRQPGIRSARLAAEARHRQEAEDRETQRRIATAKREQVERALEISQLYEEERRLKEYLDHLENTLPEFTVEFQRKLKGWLRTVRNELNEDPPHLRKLTETILQPFWHASQPDWWPLELSWPSRSAD